MKLSTLRARLRHLAVELEKRPVNPGTGSAYDMLVFRDARTIAKQTLFTVTIDDLFDAHGNRFEDDL